MVPGNLYSGAAVAAGVVVLAFDVAWCPALVEVWALHAQYSCC
jgi:hypothetical protein